jgi:tRNA dimethylallyltransferase
MITLWTSKPNPLAPLPPVIVILGPTASGKTSLAARLAFETGGEVISADSRQVYRGMDLGTGKDLCDYVVEGVKVPYHIIDIADPGYEYNIYEFRQDFLQAYQDIVSRKKLPLLCGGSGMYLESVIRNYHLPLLEEDPEADAFLKGKTDEELISFYETIRKPHNTTEYTSRERLEKAVRLAIRSVRETKHDLEFPDLEYRVFGIAFERAVLRQRITERLESRLEGGLVAEVRGLLGAGVPPDRLKSYGLEYKYVTLFLEGAIPYEEMFARLNTAIHQFAKRQMTWFRKMERNGINIRWINGSMNTADRVSLIKKTINPWF